MVTGAALFHLTLKAMLHQRICNDYFSATQRCNAVAILFWNVATLYQHCCPKNRRCKSSRVTSPWHFFRAPVINKPFHSNLIVRLPVTLTLRSVGEILWYYLWTETSFAELFHSAIWFLRMLGKGNLNFGGGVGGVVSAQLEIYLLVLSWHPGTA